MKTDSRLVPLLVVRGAARAIDFYVRALGATVSARYEHGPQRHVSHADLTAGDAAFAVTEEARAWNSDAPPSLGGSPVVLQLNVSDVDGVFESLRDAGATIVFPPAELFGERMARVRDPFGHLWLLRQRLVELSTSEIQRQRDELFSRFAQPETTSTLNESSGARQASAARLHLVVGPVGAGKSTFALGLAREERALRLTLDDWMATLFRADRPGEGVMEWYAARTARCIEQIWKLALASLELGTAVILEIGLLRRAERASLYQRVAGAGSGLTIHVLDAAREVRRERVLGRNREQGATFSMVVPPEIFELASDLWEPLDETECEGRDVRFLRTDVTSPANDRRGEPDGTPRDTGPAGAPAGRPGDRS